MVVAALDELGVRALDRAEGHPVAAPKHCTWHVCGISAPA